MQFYLTAWRFNGDEVKQAVKMILDSRMGWMDFEPEFERAAKSGFEDRNKLVRARRSSRSHS